MPSYIVKMHDDQGTPWYFMWSSVVDAPTSCAMTLPELRGFYQAEHGRQGMAELTDRLKRVEAKGTSCRLDESAEDTIEPCNRAGKGETWLTARQQLELVIRWRTDTSFEIEGVDHDFMCCRCGKPIADRADLVRVDDDSMHKGCA